MYKGQLHVSIGSVNWPRKWAVRVCSPWGGQECSVPGMQQKLSDVTASGWIKSFSLLNAIVQRIIFWKAT